MVAVIGDIHGCSYTLERLYDQIIKEHGEIPVYSVGDLVDRGNNSYETIEFIIKKDISFTPGNHDYMFYHFFKNPSSIFARSWLFNGSENTLESYERHEEAVFPHIEAIKKAPFFFNLDDCFISHAGISNQFKKFFSKNNILENENELADIIDTNYKNDSGVLWSRDRLMNIGKLQIVGHTKQKDVFLDEEANAAYIDTGACVGNKLSAVIVEKNSIINILEEKTHLNDII